MVDIFVESGGIGITCPGTTPINTVVRTEGTYTFRFVNVGDEDGVVRLQPSMFDTAGHNFQWDQAALVVPAGGSVQTSTGVLRFDHKYGAAGPVAVKIRVVVSGAMNDSKEALCTFIVA